MSDEPEQHEVLEPPTTRSTPVPGESPAPVAEAIEPVEPVEPVEPTETPSEPIDSINTPQEPAAENGPDGSSPADPPAESTQEENANPEPTASADITPETVDPNQSQASQEGQVHVGGEGEREGQKKEEHKEQQEHEDHRHDEAGDFISSSESGTHIPGPPKRLTQGFYYDTDTIALPDTENYLPGNFIRFSHSIGFESHKRNNVYYIDRRTIVFSSGNTVQFLNLESMQQRYLFGLHSRGVGAICVHPSKRFIAVGEKGNNPGIFVYEYPSLKLYRILRRGTEKGYSSLAFNTGGDKLASVGAYPDYMLTVWDWMQESIILRYKAFSQDIFKVSFFPNNDGRLTTSGTGHIRFWKMARTFTGLKLQGDIGKFGNVELTDVSSFAEWPDGKVICGTEKGTLLMWDGNLIKMEISRKEGRPCHEGMVEAVMLEDNILYTAGHDGYIRMWSYEAIENADLSEGYSFELEPKGEFRIGQGVVVKSLVRGRKHWLVQGAEGNLWQFDDELQQPMGLISYHSGAVRATATSPVQHNLCSIGADGSVRLYDYIAKKLLCQTHFNASGECLVYAPKSIDGNGLTIAAGFGDGVVRILTYMEQTLSIVDVFKPHTGAVKHICYSPNGQFFVTASDDHVIFFFEVKESYSSIGFTTTKEKAKFIQWHPSSLKILVHFERDLIQEIEVPESSRVDTSVSYEIQVNTRDISVQIPIFREYVRRIVADQRASKRVLPRPKEGEELTEEQLAFIAAENEKEENILREMFGVQISIAHMSYTKEGNAYHLNLTGPCADYLFVVPFDNPRAFESHASHHPQISYANYSSRGSLLLTGGTDGSVIARQVGDMKSCWRGLLHDSEYGSITSICTSFDESHLFTAGRDGNLFIYRVSISDMVVPSEEAEKVAAAKKESLTIKEDITDKSMYSIQEAKLKSEHDRRVAEAETKKQAVRRQLGEIRQEFQRLLKSNERAPPQLTLDRVEFNVETQLKEEIERQTSEKIELARRKLAWVCEKKKLSLNKLKSKFLDILAVERILLKGFKNYRVVSTFRVAKLSPQLKENIEAVHSIINSEEAVKLEEGVVENTQQNNTTGPAASTTTGDVAEAAAVDVASLSKAEARKAQRDARAKVWEELMAKKPDEKYEDPDDVAAIIYAEKHMGDYKLKTDSDYIVPEHQRVNAEKKRRQMILLEESVFSIKMDFNERLLALRDLKIRIVERIKTDNMRIREINGLLSIREDLFEPVLESNEFPEDRFRYTKESVARFEAKRLKQAERAKRAAQKRQGFGNFGGGGDDSDGSDEDIRKQDARLPTPNQGGARGRSGTHTSRAERLQNVPLSETEAAEQLAAHRKLMYEKQMLLDKITKTVAAFDSALDDLRHEKFKLEGDLKTTDMKMLILYQELVLLKEFELRDVDLIKKLDAKKAEKADIVAKITECQEKLVAKKQEIEKLLEKDKEVHEEFNAIVGEKDKLYDPLLKIFKKKVKRTKKKQARDNPDEEYNSEEEEEEDDESEYNSDEEEEEEEVCPPGCEQQVYERVCALRERRLDQEEILNEIQKSIETLKKENDTFVKKEKVIDAALKTAEGEIQAFQTEKQQKLNELDVVLTLKLHQIQNLVEGAFPEDMTQSLVFTNDGIRNLRQRIKDLKDEKLFQRRKQKDLDHEHLNLLKDKKSRQQNINSLDAKAFDVQMLKFGQAIDLEMIERMSVNKTAEELKERIRKEERERAVELEQWTQKIGGTKDDLMQSTQRNTAKLHKLAELSQTQQQLEASLNHSQNTLAAEYTTATKKEGQERKRLTELIQNQRREIEALRAEINMLGHKGGHIYAPIPNTTASSDFLEKSGTRKSGTK